MKNALSALVLAILLFLPSTAMAGATSDINHRGWFHHETTEGAIRPAEWRRRTTECKPCETLIDQYNTLGAQLMEVRYRIAYNDMLVRENDKAIGKRMREKHGEASQDVTQDKHSDSGLDFDDPVRALGNLTEFTGAMENINSDLRVIEQKILIELHGLIPQIENCEKQCIESKPKGKYSGIMASEIEVEGLKENPPPPRPLPFPWAGPYPDVCHKCAKLAARLNEIPDMARKRLIAIDDIEKRLAVYEAYKATAERYRLGMSRSSLTWEMEQDFGLSENRFDPDRLVREKKKLEEELEKIIENFNQTLRLYNECVPTCQQQEQRQHGALPGNKSAACPKPPATQPINVGKASEVGSAGKTKSDMKNKAIGMLMGGGGGFSMGGGGFGRGPEAMVPGPASGGGGGDKPKVEKDPVKKKVTATAPGGSKLALGASVRDGQLLVSSSIKDSPGKGTFQTVFLENADGQRMEPIAYYIYELWLNWTLNVWWTHDRYVDGQHVLHEEGEWSKQGKEKVGSNIIPIYQKGKEKIAAVWNRLGFSHAAEGVKGVGALFPVDLAKSGPVSVVVHTTLPKQDPVMTDPFVFTLSDDGKGGVTVEAASSTVACP